MQAGDIQRFSALPGLTREKIGQLKTGLTEKINVNGSCHP
jgi:hypothetical protein